MLWRLLRFALLALLVSAWTVAGLSYLESTQEQIAYFIQAHTEPELASPVYAQFVYTQFIEMNSLRRLSSLAIPVYSPATGLPYSIRLYRNDRLVYAWRHETGYGLEDVSLPLPQPQLFDGRLAIEIAAPSVSSDRAAEAPRVFVEKDKDKFTLGSYKIADNAKQGNIAMKLYETRTQKERLIERLKSREAWTATSELAAWLTLALLSIGLPLLLPPISSLNQLAGQKKNRHPDRDCHQ